MKHFLLIIPLLFGLAGVSAAESTYHASSTAYPGTGIQVTIPDRDIVIVIQPNGRDLLAADLATGTVLWKVDLISLHMPEVGVPVLRHLQVKGDVVIVTAGKHTFYEVIIQTGEARWIGSD